jgi:hypothetical protein
VLPAHREQLSRWCPKASFAFPHKQLPSSVCVGRKSNPRISRKDCPICTYENSKLINDNIFPKKNAVCRNLRTLCGISKSPCIFLNQRYTTVIYQNHRRCILCRAPLSKRFHLSTSSMMLTGRH